MQTAVWNDIPPLRELLAAAARNRRLAVCLPEKRIPRFEPSEQPDEAERRFLQHWPQQSACLQFAAANILHGLLPQGAELRPRMADRSLPAKPCRRTKTLVRAV